MENGIYASILIAASYYDWKENRIPNVLCLFSAGLGAVLLFLQNQGGQLPFMGIQCLLLFFLLFPFWLLGVLGAGDIKLILSGVFLLKEDLGMFLCFGGICTALLSFFYMIKRKNLRRRCLLFYRYILECVKEKRVNSYPFNRNRDGSDGGIQVSYGLLLGQLCVCLIRFYHRMG